MINEYKEIVKNYYNLVKEDKKKLIPYYIGYFFNVVRSEEHTSELQFTE